MKRIPNRLEDGISVTPKKNIPQDSGVYFTNLTDTLLANVGTRRATSLHQIGLFYNTVITTRSVQDGRAYRRNDLLSLHNLDSCLRNSNMRQTRCSSSKTNILVR